MYETKLKWFKKVLGATLCFLAVCGSLSAMLFVPNKEEETPQVPIEKELCVYSAPLQVSPTPTPIPIEEEPAEPEADPNPYAELSPTDTEKELLACMAYSEAGNQSFDGQVAVVQVALNRYMHEAYSGSISDILLAPYQFAVESHYDPEQMEAVEAALAGYPALDLNTDVVYFSTGCLTYGSYYKTIGNHVFRTYT